MPAARWWLVVALLAGAPSAALALELRLTLEPGIGTVRTSRAERALGVMGGVAAGVALDELTWIEARFDRRHFLAFSPAFAATTGGLSFCHALDVLALRPFIEIGVAYVALSYLDPHVAAVRDPLPRSFVPVLGVGFDAAVRRWLWAGAGFRYLPILGSDLQGDPAYAMISLRLSAIL